MPSEKMINLVKLAGIAAGTFALAKIVLPSKPQYSFADKTVLITGGSRGLGLVLARQLAQEHARVVICARDEEELERARRDLQRVGADPLALKCDITNTLEVAATIETIHKEVGHIDVLINNAGVIQVGPYKVMTREDFENAMNTHFWGPLNLIVAVLPEMRRRREGRIVNISSIGGKISVPHLLPYSASKFALVGLSKGLRAELRKEGIIVTTVCPGLMRTGSPRNAYFKGRHRAEYAWFSISDALPLTSISAERAARQIIVACQRGEAELIISIQAKLAVLFDALFPDLTADLLGVVNNLLPEAGGIGIRQAKGKESESTLSPSWLTSLNEGAAARNNEIN
jgi:NAD(P)-dependent dehydrogenase (short-subunit alcohol dehydrogenase family)